MKTTLCTVLEFACIKKWNFMKVVVDDTRTDIYTCVYQPLMYLETKTWRQRELCILAFRNDNHWS
jgi:hypothetical protein